MPNDDSELTSSPLHTQKISNEVTDYLRSVARRAQEITSSKIDPKVARAVREAVQTLEGKWEDTDKRVTKIERRQSGVFNAFRRAFISITNEIQKELKEPDN